MSIDPIDAAFEKLVELYPRLAADLEQVVTEQDVRLKIVDPFFIEILGWNTESVTTEERTGSQDGFLDYKFSIGGRARLVVEAKKKARSFGLEQRSAINYKLNGPVLNVSPLPHEGIVQAVRYCGDKNAELACVTNGREWIVFRGSRLGDGLDTFEGQAFVFSNLESVKRNFKTFFDLLSRASVEKYLYRAYFQEAEGRRVRVHSFSRTVAQPGTHQLLPTDKIHSDLTRVMDTFFRRLSGDEDEEMLAKCFVTTKESQVADNSLVRISEDLIRRVRNLDTETGASLTEVISTARASGKNEFVLLVGTKGAGKSTFIDRFFRFVLPKALREDCIIIRIDVGKNDGDTQKINEWLTDQLTRSLEAQLFNDGVPTYDELQGMFFDEYTRWNKGPYTHLYSSNKTEFKIRFGGHVEDLREKRPVDYINRLLSHIVTVRKKIPCLIFDNTDHFSIEFQERVFQFARAIYENLMCLIITPITDKTSWQLSQQGALRSFESQSFYLPTPLPKQVLEKRISFLGEKLATEQDTQKGTGYFIGKGIQLSMKDLQGFAQTLQQALIETGKTSQWLGSLANRDIRRCLDLTREVICSPYLPLDEMVKAVVASSSYRFDEGNLIRAVIRRGYNRYPGGNNPFVQNIFSLNTEIDSTPLLGLRILRLLRDAKHHEASGLEMYLTLDQVLDYAQAIGVDRQAALLTVETLLKTGLCMNYDPTKLEIADVQRIQISPSGEQHLAWGAWDENYIGSMVVVTPIQNQATYNEIVACKDLPGRERWRRQLYLFIRYLLDEDQGFVTPNDHPAYEGQEVITKSLRRRMRRVGKQLSNP